MKKYYQNRKYQSYFLAISSIFFMLYGLFLFLKYVNNPNYTYNESFSISAVPFSFGLAVFAISLALWADIKMDIDSNESFLQIVDDFEDKRIELYWLCRSHNYNTLLRDIWKFYRYTERAVKLYEMKNIRKENVTLYFDQIDKLIFWTAIPWRSITRTHLRREDIDKILKICILLNEFKLSNIQKTKLESLIDYSRYLLNYYPI